MAITGRTHIRWRGNQEAINECHAAYMKLKPKRKKKRKRPKVIEKTIEPEDRMILTKRLLLEGMRSGVGMKRAQAVLLGIPYPLRKGWKDRAIGKVVSKKAYAMFTQLTLFEREPDPVDEEYQELIS